MSEIEQYKNQPITIPAKAVEYIGKDVGDLKKQAYRQQLRPTSLTMEPLISLTPLGIKNLSFEWAMHGPSDKVRKDVYVRETVAGKLVAVDDELKNGGYELFVRCGFRHPEVQEKQFATAEKRHGEQFARSRLAAKTDLVGSDSNYPHATGGAVDVEIWKGGQRITMGEKGVPIGVFDLEYQAQKANFPINWKEFLENRRLLYHLMRGANFYFILGEFWHWGMGDHLSGVAAYLLGEKDYRPWYGLASLPKD